MRIPTTVPVNTHTEVTMLTNGSMFLGTHSATLAESGAGGGHVTVSDCAEALTVFRNLDTALTPSPTVTPDASLNVKNHAARVVPDVHRT